MKIFTEDQCNCVGPGWRVILETLDKVLVSILRNSSTNLNVPEKDLIYFSQIKEKFGGIRIYHFLNEKVQDFPLVDRFVDQAIRFAETLSFHVCENCGNTIEVETRGPLGKQWGWVRTLCKPCHIIEDLK